MAYDIRMHHEKILIYKSKQNGRWVVSPPSCIRYKDRMTSNEHDSYENALSDALVVRVLVAIELRRQRAAQADCRVRES